MIKTKHYLYLIFIIYVFCSCSRGMMQKAYITNPPNVCFFDSAESRKMKFIGNFRYLENQMSFGLTDKWGLSSNLLLGLKGQYGADLGIVYYKNFKDKTYFELGMGYGYFNSHSVGSIGMDGAGLWGSDGDYYSQNLKCNYHKLFFQPTLASNSAKTNFGFTFRISVPYYTVYNCRYDVTTYEHDGESETIKEYGTANFKNKFGVTFEPILTLRSKEITNISNKSHRWYLQLGGCFSPSILKKDSFKNWGDYNYNTEQVFPLHANLFINLGLEFNIAKSKQNKKRYEVLRTVQQIKEYEKPTEINEQQPKTATEKPKEINEQQQNVLPEKALNNSDAQKMLVMHKRDGKKDHIVNLGRRIKIITKDYQKLIGKLIIVKDSSIIIIGKGSKEIPLKDINVIAFNTSPWIKYPLGIPLAALSGLFVLSTEGIILAPLTAFPAYLLLDIRQFKYGEYDFKIILSHNKSYKNWYK